MSSTIPQPLPASTSRPLTLTQSDASASPALVALLHQAAFAPLPHRAWLRVAGEDRARWLNGMVTNAVAALPPGEGCYNFFLNVQGQIQGDADIFALAGHLLLETGAAELPALQALLDRFIIMDDVELTPIPAAEWQGLLLAGPEAAGHLTALGLVPTAEAIPSPNPPSAATPGRLSLRELAWNSHPLHLISHPGPLVPRVELWGPPAALAALVQHLRQAGLPEAGTQSLEALRTLEGTPRFGTDIRGRELPQETAQDHRALHFSKGCYLGQEIVERIHSRGKVHRTFFGFVLEGSLPAPETELLVDGKAVGVLTTVTQLPPLPGNPAGARLALGYIRRDALETPVPLTYPGGTAQPSALPFPLPSR